ncbi:unnamed protein product [Arabidopsis thaliana]|uniref:Uncharacterized protein n=1 Tax=Arabidopsis thaliana TaxID=3702 RepID=Q9LT01_ARATH|nr:unnamed protein product [Arabidopsis thaliana]
MCVYIYIRVIKSTHRTESDQIFYKNRSRADSDYSGRVWLLDSGIAQAYPRHAFSLIVDNLRRRPT